MENSSFEDYKIGDKKVPYTILKKCKGKDLEGIRYKQLINGPKPKKVMHSKY